MYTAKVMEMLVQANRDLMRTPGCQSRMEVIFKEQVEEAERMIAAGADVNRADENGWTPLMEGCIFGNYNYVQLLLQNKADVSARDIEGRTALDVATDNQHPDIVNLFTSMDLLI